MKTITLKNDFHNTEVNIRVSGKSPWTLSVSQTKRVDRTLCGMADCSCGGIRGPQNVSIDYDSDRDGNMQYVLDTVDTWGRAVD